MNVSTTCRGTRFSGCSFFLSLSLSLSLSAGEWNVYDDHEGSTALPVLPLSGSHGIEVGGRPYRTEDGFNPALLDRKTNNEYLEKVQMHPIKLLRGGIRFDLTMYLEWASFPR